MVSLPVTALDGAGVRKTREWASPTRDTIMGVTGDNEAVGNAGVGAGAACAFCRIVSGEDAARIVFADEVAVGFLDRVPLFPGHMLIVPRVHADTLSDLPAHEVGPFFLRVQRAAAVVESALDASGTFVAMNNRISQSVPHLHAHVVPRRPKDGLRGFFWPRTRYDSDEHAANVARVLAGEWDAFEASAGLHGDNDKGE